MCRVEFTAVLLLQQATVLVIGHALFLPRDSHGRVIILDEERAASEARRQQSRQPTSSTKAVMTAAIISLTNSPEWARVRNVRPIHKVLVQIESPSSSRIASRSSADRTGDASTNLIRSMRSARLTEPNFRAP